MLLKGDRLLVGLKNGDFQILNLKNEEYLESYTLFQSSISALSEGKDSILVASMDGEVAALSRDGSIIWKTRPSNYSIHGLIENDLGIHFIDRTGKYFLLSQETGLTLKEGQFMLNPSIRSNAVILNGWVVLNDGMGVRTISSDHKSILTYQMVGPRADSYIREFRSHPRGFITGDDGGVIRFWALGQLKSPIFSELAAHH